MFSGKATAEGTTRYSSWFSLHGSNQFFRATGDLTVSSIGIGTYLGAMDERTSQNYVEAIQSALSGGVNFIDTSLNYRNQRSEQDIGSALQEQVQKKAIAREEFIVCTKAGYLVPNALPEHTLRKSDIVGGMHSMAPAFLEDQLERSRRNLNLETIDIFYLHNPETQLDFVPIEDVYLRFQDSFSILEEFVAQGRIAYYGAATWNGFREKPASQRALSLTRLVEIARTVAGDHHHFRYIQLPFNLAMAEAFIEKNERANGRPATVLEVAERSGITVIASASLLQSKLSQNLPEVLSELLVGPRNDAQRAIQFTRSTPGITVALIGMSSPGHVTENLDVAGFRPASRDEYMRLFV